jgi:polysaccharide chain length determinant protein (PEP-CTERM system associated)
MIAVYDQILSILYLMWRKRWHGIAVAWLVCLVGWGVVAALPDVYQANARIFIQTNDQLRALIPEANATNVFRQVDVVKRTLTSRPNMEKVIRRTDLDLTLAPDDDAAMEKMIDTLTDNIALRSQGDDLFTLSYTSGNSRLSDAENAALSQRVVQNLINIFVEENARGGRDEINQARSFLEEQIAEYERRLEQAETRKSEFQRQNFGVADGGFSGRLLQLQGEKSQLESRLLELRSQRAAIGAQLGIIPQSVPGGVMMMSGGGSMVDPGSAAGQVAMYERQIAEMNARGWTASHPDILAARAQIAQLRPQADAERRAAASGRADPSAGPMQPNPVYVQTRMQLIERDTQIASTQARLSQIAGEIASIETKVQTTPAIESERLKLNRDYGAIKSKYDELVAQRERATVAINAEAGTEPFQIRVVDPPEVPLQPIAPNRLFLLTAVLLAGLAAGVGLSFLLSQLQPRFVTINQLRNLTALPVLGSVSAVLSDQQSNQARLWAGIFLVALASLLTVYAGLLTWELWQSGVLG